MLMFGEKSNQGGLLDQTNFDPPKTTLHNRTDTNYSPAIMNIDKFGDHIFLHCP